MAADKEGHQPPVRSASFVGSHRSLWGKPVERRQSSSHFAHWIRIEAKTPFIGPPAASFCHCLCTSPWQRRPPSFKPVLGRRGICGCVSVDASATRQELACPVGCLFAAELRIHNRQGLSRRCSRLQPDLGEVRDDQAWLDLQIASLRVPVAELIEALASLLSYVEIALA